MVTAYLYRTRMRHVRKAPPARAFTYHSYLWFFDLADPPRLPRVLRPLAALKASDHIGDAGRPIQANIEELLAGHAIDLTGGRVMMLGSLRVLGYVFNPLTLFWCYDATDTLACVVAEVHNTYGGRHAYVVTARAGGRTYVEKDFYIPPFLPLTGLYRMYLPAPSERLSVTVSLHDRTGPLFAATLHGLREPATITRLIGLSMRFPLAPLLTSLRIRLQGIRLWLRWASIHPRPHVTDRQRSSGET